MQQQFMPQHDALLRRLDLIKSMAADATRQQQTTLDMQRQRRMQEMERDYAQQMLDQASTGRNQMYSNSGVPSPNAVAGRGNFNSFLNAIGGKESGGKYSAVNPHSGALGKYQIMPSNIAGWSKSALGYSISRNTFLNNPQLQEQVAQHVLKGYYDKYGPAGAAVAWYAGEGTAKKWLKSGGSGYNRTQTYDSGQYPSINSYVNDILRRMR